MARRLPPLQITADTNTEIANQWKLEWHRDFTGGENKLILPELVNPNQLLSAQNCVLSAEGLPETRKGKFRFNATEFGTTGITSFFRYSKESGFRALIVQQQEEVYAVEWDGSSPITSLGDSIKTLTDDVKLHYVTWKDRVFATNGVDALFTIYYDGADWVVEDVPDSPPLSSIIAVYANRLWLVPTTQPNAVQFCNLEDYETWDVLDIIKIRDADGDTIRALSPQPGGLVIAKSKSIWTLYGTNLNNFTLPNAPIFADDGCVSQDSFLDIGVFLGANGIYSFTLTEVTPVFTTHKSVIQGLTSEEKAASFGVVDPIERRILFSLGNGDILCIQEQIKTATQEKYFAVMTWTNLNAGCMVVANDAEDPCNLLIGDKDSGFIYNLTNEVNDAGTPIQTYIKTFFSDKNIAQDKVWRRFSPEIEMLAGEDDYSVLLSYDTDYAVSIGEKTFLGVLETLIWGVSLWGETWGNRLRKFYDYFFEVRGRRISFGIETNNRIKLLGYQEKFREVVPQ